MFKRRKNESALVTGLTREVRARRVFVHDAIERTLDDDRASYRSTEGSRLNRVFASFQGDFDSEEAGFMYN
jgi:hypothetical protein